MLHPGEMRWRYTAAELWADGAIHVVGILCAVLGSAALMLALAGRTTPEETAAVAVYLTTLVVSLGASGLYNIWPVSRTKWILRRFDHSAIYLLIAGTYTPFMLKAGTGWLLSGVWLIAAVGVFLKLLRPGRFDRLSILLYLGLGWSGMIACDLLVATLPPSVFWLILAGGLVYSFGVVFHVLERLRFQNVIWHACVLVAAAIHFVAVWFSTLSRG